MIDANMNDVTVLAENDGKKQLHSLFDKVSIRKKIVHSNTFPTILFEISDRAV